MYPNNLPRALLVAHYLLHCAAYYVYDTNFVEDSIFDELARRLDEEWEDVYHVHKNLVERSSIKSSGYYLVGKFPLIVLNSVEQFLIDGLPKGNFVFGDDELLFCGKSDSAFLLE